MREEVKRISSEISLQRTRVKVGEVVLEPYSLSERYLSFVSHAHSDHLPKRGRGRALADYITLRYIEGAIPAKEPSGFSLLPAGHVPGARMLYYEGEISLLYTGDFSLHSSPLYEGARPKKAEILMIDATYGYRECSFPPREEEIKRMLEYLEDLDRATILTYSFGKPQEILAYMRKYFGKGFEEEVALSERIYEKTLKMRDLLSSIGIQVDSFSDPGRARYYLTCSWPRKGDLRIAVSGMPRRADVQFWISDHADYYDTLQFVEKCSPSLVVVTNGPTRDLNEDLDVPVISFREFRRILQEIE